MAEPTIQLRPGPRIDHRSSFDPTAARLKDSVTDLIELGRAMGIRADREQDACFLRGSRHGIVQIELVHGAVNLQRYAGFERNAMDALEIEVQRFARANQPAGGMRQNVDVRIGKSVDQTACGLIIAMAKPRVNRRDDDIEPGKNIVGIVQLSIAMLSIFFWPNPLSLADAAFSSQLFKSSRWRISNFSCSKASVLGPSPGILINSTKPAGMPLHSCS